MVDDVMVEGGDGRTQQRNYAHQKYARADDQTHSERERGQITHIEKAVKKEPTLTLITFEYYKRHGTEDVKYNSPTNNLHANVRHI